MILAKGKENGLNWSLDAKGMNIYIRVIQDNTNKEFVKKYECQFEPKIIIKIYEHKRIQNNFAK